MKETRKGMLLVISGPSGTGKGTLAAKLLRDDPSFTFSVSVTTRAKRSNEIEDVHYHFLSDEEYDKLLAEDAFLEHATVHGHRYGTLKSEVYERMERGQNVLLDIDPQGAKAVMEQEKECVSVFILPPSYKMCIRDRAKEDSLLKVSPKYAANPQASKTTANSPSTICGVVMRMLFFMT